MNKKSFQKVLSVWLSLGVLTLLVISFKWNSLSAFFKKENKVPKLNEIIEKQKGAHVFGLLDTINLAHLRKYNLEWITLVPFAGQKYHNSSSISYRKRRGGEQDRDSILQNQITLARQFGFKVFLKPHIWILDPSDGKWRSDIFPNNDEEWELWKTGYTSFILNQAKIAEKTNTEMFCIGTEFTRLTLEKPEYFEGLIKEVRKVYSGKLTYAANWYQEYEQITFWEDLDYIGIQAYFPLVNNLNPSTDEIVLGWNKYLPKLESFSTKYNRKILFTELGYKSTPEAAKEPWHWIDHESLDQEILSYETQSNAYAAFFKSVWIQNWFEGVHFWQLRSDRKGRESPKRKFDFTPQGKPAEKVIANGFKK